MLPVASNIDLLRFLVILDVPLKSQGMMKIVSIGANLKPDIFLCCMA